MITRSKQYIISLTLCVMFINSVQATIVDNRYFPLYDKLFLRSADRRSLAGADIFFITAKKARDRFGRDMHIPDMHGCFDQITIGKAITAIGQTNPLRPDLQAATEIKWDMKGKLQGEGFSFWYEQSLSDYFSVGFSGLFMHVNSRIEFYLPRSTCMQLGLDDGAFEQLDRERRQALAILGLDAPQWGAANLGDFDAYMRVGKIGDYLLRMRQIDINVRAGVLVPTGQLRDENNPAAVPFGGQGHWGGYVELNTDFELREDWKTGLAVRVDKRYKKTRLLRMPVVCEPLFFGAVCGRAEVDPGFTFSFAPYIAVENIRDGFGVLVRYLYANHRKDCWVDKRADNTIPVTLGRVVDSSDWISEYFTFNLFYDFGKTEDDPSYVPRLSVAFEIPSDIFRSRDVSETHRVALGFEVNF